MEPTARSFAVATLLVALAASETRAQEHHRSGSVARIDVGNLRPVPLSAGLRGWALDLPGGHPLATPAVDSGVVFIGAGFGSHEFYAVDATTGRVRWAIRASDDGPTGAVVDDGFVVFNTESCTLFVLAAATGEMVWSKWLGDPLMSQPAVAGGRVFMAYPTPAGHRLAAFDLRTGRTLWERPISGDLLSAPVVSGDSVYGTTVGGQVVRFAAQDGQPRYAREERATSAPWVRGDRVYVSLHDETASDRAHGPVEGLGFLRSGTGVRGNAPGKTWGRRSADYLDERVQAQSTYRSSRVGSDSNVGFGGGAPSTAGIGNARSNLGRGTVSEVWEYQGSRPLVVGRTSYSTMGDELRAIDTESGAQRWSRRMDGDLRREGGHLATPPALAGGRLVSATTSGKVLVVLPATGQVVSSWEVGQPIRSQAAVVGGRVYVGTTAGRLVMIETGDRTLDGWPMWGGSAAHIIATDARAVAAGSRASRAGSPDDVAPAGASGSAGPDGSGSPLSPAVPRPPTSSVALRFAASVFCLAVIVGIALARRRRRRGASHDRDNGDPQPSVTSSRAGEGPDPAAPRAGRPSSTGGSPIEKPDRGLDPGPCAHH